MREIKFRGKFVADGTWVEGDLQHHIDKNGTLFCFIVTDFSDLSNPIVWEVDPSTVGQFTGLKDKNGAEIYEGDVLNQDGCHVVIAFSGGWFVGRMLDLIGGDVNNRNWMHWEIIGNIHDNPELLK